MQVVQSLSQLLENFKGKMWNNTAGLCKMKCLVPVQSCHKDNATSTLDIAVS